MSQHLASIGFPIQVPDDLQVYIEHALRHGRRFSTSQGSYVCWSSRSGAELWVKLDLEGQVLEVNPFFSGHSKMSVAIEERIAAETDGSLEGAFYGWMSGYYDRSEGSNPRFSYNGIIPLGFNTPNYAMYDRLNTPGVFDARLVGFAQSLQAFDSVEDYYRWSKGKNLMLSSEAFFPDHNPEVNMLFTAYVLDSMPLVNEFTSCRYEWAWVRTYGGEIDIVAQPDQVDGKLVPGGTVMGRLWMTGKILSNLLY
jgi:hypothetical protein